MFSLRGHLIVKPESEVPKSRPKGLGLTLKSLVPSDSSPIKDKIPVLELDIVERQV